MHNVLFGFVITWLALIVCLSGILGLWFMMDWADHSSRTAKRISIISFGICIFTVPILVSVSIAASL